MSIDQINSDIYKIDWLCECIKKGRVTILMNEINYFMQYWGRYLEDIDNFWVYEKSNYYESCYIQGCKLIGLELQKNKEYIKATELYKNILYIDCFDEDAMKELLKCYCEMGDWKGLREKYDVFVSKFKTEMGIDSVVSLDKILKEKQRKQRLDY